MSQQSHPVCAVWVRFKYEIQLSHFIVNSSKINEIWRSSAGKSGDSEDSDKWSHRVGWLTSQGVSSSSHHNISSSDVLCVFFLLWTVYLSANSQLPTPNSFNATTLAVHLFSKYFEGKPEAQIACGSKTFNLQNGCSLNFSSFTMF